MAQSDAMETLARGLGWFSIALGAAEVVAPGTLAGALGMKKQHRRTLRAYGMREIANGVGLLAARDPRPWVMARVARDALDIATLAAAGDRDRRRRNVGIALAAVAGVTALDIVCSAKLGNGRVRSKQPVRDYGDRSGFPRPPEQMRGAAARDFDAPRDMRTPEALRPYTTAPQPSAGESAGAAPAAGATQRSSRRGGSKTR